MHAADSNHALTMADYDLIYERAPARWLDGVPLGNGYLGVMLWGSGEPLRLTLGRPDIWELREPQCPPARKRYDVIKSLVEAKKWGELNHVVNFLPEGHPNPTMLPLPRMEIHDAPYTGGRLCLETAHWEAGSHHAFVHAARKLLVIKWMRSQARVTVDYVRKDAPSISPDIRAGAWGWPGDCLPAWGYPPLERGEQDGVAWVRQSIPESGEYVIAWRRRDDELLVTILTHRDAATPVRDAVRLLAEAPAWNALFEEHTAWWRAFWSRSALTLPDKRLENLYHAELYKLGSSTRPDGVAMPVQGVWPMDGVLPPCHGAYILDWNLQAAYWLVFGSNHLELGESYYRTFDAMLPRFRENCRQYYGIEGLWTTAAIGLDGVAPCWPQADLQKTPNPIGWEPLFCVPSMLPWVAHNYWLHYRYSDDVAFLRRQALPLLKGCWRVYAHVLEKGPDGTLHLPIACSPEYLERTPDIWQKDTSFDAALIRFLCHALLEAERVLNDPDPDHDRYQDMLARLYDYPGGDDIWIGADLPLTQSHRHHCHLLGVYPLEELTIEGSERDRKRIDRALLRVQQLGTGQWGGHGFTAHALVAARAGFANMAWNWLQQYAAFLIGPNTLTRHGDYRRFGVSRVNCELTAVDAGFSAATALLEMLLQSWGGVIRVFPAVPEFWADVSFRNLLAEGAVHVSAEKKDGRIRWIELGAARDCGVRVKNVFGGAVRAQHRVLTGDVLEIALTAGATLRLEPATAVADEPGPAAGQRVSGTHWFGLKRIPNF